MSDRRTAILEAAATVIARRGVRGLRVEELAVEAGVSKALIYYHFEDRTGLLRRTLAFVNNRAERYTAEQSAADAAVGPGAVTDPGTTTGATPTMRPAPPTGAGAPAGAPGPPPRTGEQHRLGRASRERRFRPRAAGRAGPRERDLGPGGGRPAGRSPADGAGIRAHRLRRTADRPARRPQRPVAQRHSAPAGRPHPDARGDRGGGGPPRRACRLPMRPTTCRRARINLTEISVSATVPSVPNRRSRRGCGRRAVPRAPG